MAEIYLTLDQFEDLIQSTTVKLLGWDLTTPSKAEDVRIEWPIEGAPGPKITDDIIYLRCVEVDSPINKQREFRHYQASPDFIQSIGFSKTMEVSYICYGPSSYDNADYLRTAIFFQDIHDLLAQNSVYLVPDIAEPKRVPELFENRWWQRADLQMRFNALVVRERAAHYIESVEVTVSTAEGEQIDIQSTISVD